MKLLLAHTRGISIEELREGYENSSTIPLGRSGNLAEVANLVAFICSDRASYIHGVTINVAGGKREDKIRNRGRNLELKSETTRFGLFFYAITPAFKPFF